jgi:predicted deacylase
MGLTYQEFESRVKALRASRGAQVREVACIGAPRTLLCVEIGDASRPTVALAAGIHGDERAGPWALLDLLETDALNDAYAYRIWPCTNPTGYAAGTRASVDGVDVNRTFGRGGSSPEARAIVMSNRDRKFALSIDLHEDCDSTGFYCYDYTGGALGAAIRSALDERSLSTEEMHAGYDLGYTLPEGARFERGGVLVDPAAEARALGAFTYTLLQARRAAARALTLETPLQAPWDARLAMHRAAVLAAIAALP